MSKKSQTRKSKFNDQQIDFLEQIYLSDPSPTANRKKELASCLNVTLRLVQNWFQTRRVLDVKTDEIQHDLGPPSPVVKGQAFKLHSRNKLSNGKNLFLFNPDALYTVTNKPQFRASSNYTMEQMKMTEQSKPNAPPSPRKTPMLPNARRQHRHTISGEQRPPIATIMPQPPQQQLLPATPLYATQRRHSISTLTPMKRVQEEEQIDDIFKRPRTIESQQLGPISEEDLMSALSLPGKFDESDWVALSATEQKIDVAMFDEDTLNFIGSLLQ